MLRFWYVIIISLPFIIYYLVKGDYIERHADAYSEEDRYRVALRVIRIMKRNGRITTSVTGVENLPKDCGYVMFPNHQGKYDALGIMDAHKKPCTVMMDEKRSHMVIVDQFITLVKGCRIDKSDIKSQVNAINTVASEVREGRRYIVFPEGGYFHNRNAVKEFMPGAFQCAVRAKSPIVPVLLVDSYKPFEINSLRKVHTQVHFLPAIYPEEYSGMTTSQIAKLVRGRIVDKMQAI
ncbi:MAG: lysophospholipid acyltransferase family protein [Wujia sp.]